MIRFVWVVLIAGVSSDVWAEVFRCEGERWPVFSDHPCGEATQPIEVPQANEIQSVPWESVSRLERARAGRLADWYARLGPTPQTEDRSRYRALIRERMVGSGMTRDEVIKSWCEPDSRGWYGGSETLRWYRGRGIERVYLRDGVVIGADRF